MLLILTQKRHHEWTKVHSFYAGMGGFVINTKNPEIPKSEAYVPGSPRVTLTVDGIFLLANLGRLPDISIESIEDRSKANNLAKGLVCLQAAWIIVQCIARLASHLPITLLEVNTSGHVICALLIYMLWWYKPLDVHDPTPVNGPWVESLCALMCMNSDVGRGATSFGKRSIESLVPFEMDYLIHVDDGILANSIPIPTSEKHFVSRKDTVSGETPVSSKSPTSGVFTHDFAAQSIDHSIAHPFHQNIRCEPEISALTSVNNNQLAQAKHDYANLLSRLANDIPRYQVHKCEIQALESKDDSPRLRHLSDLLEQTHLPEEQSKPEQMALFLSLQPALEQISITSWSEYHTMIRLLHQIKGMSYSNPSPEKTAQEKLLRTINIRCDMVEFLSEPVAPECTVVTIRPLQLLASTSFGLDPNSPKLLPRGGS